MWSIKNRSHDYFTSICERFLVTQAPGPVIIGTLSKRQTPQALINHPEYGGEFT
jgi:hypothetical protein